MSRGGSPAGAVAQHGGIALDADAMHKIPRRVGVSYGVSKALPNIGAARPGLINVLITDEHAAEEMLALIDASRSER
jgi:DNA-binding transcriptional regulator LsrR (DeoR family)